MSDLPLAKWKELAQQDNWHNFFVGSDIRQMLGEIERLQSQLAEAKLALEAPTKEEIALREQIAEARKVLEPMSDPRYEVLRVAVLKIAWPMMALREFAEDQGHDFNANKAIEIANDPEYLKNIARIAMADIAVIDPAGVNDRPILKTAKGTSE